MAQPTQPEGAGTKEVVTVQQQPAPPASVEGPTVSRKRSSRAAAHDELQALMTQVTEETIPQMRDLAAVLQSLRDGVSTEDRTATSHLAQIRIQFSELVGGISARKRELEALITQAAKLYAGLKPGGETEQELTRLEERVTQARRDIEKLQTSASQLFEQLEQETGRLESRVSGAENALTDYGTNFSNLQADVDRWVEQTREQFRTFSLEHQRPPLSEDPELGARPPEVVEPRLRPDPFGPVGPRRHERPAVGRREEFLGEDLSVERPRHPARPLSGADKARNFLRGLFGQPPIA